MEQLQRTAGYQAAMASAGAIVTFLRYGPVLDQFMERLIDSVVPAFIPAPEPVAALNAPARVCPFGSCSFVQTTCMLQLIVWLCC
jgi:hypothetical protein